MTQLTSQTTDLQLSKLPISDLHVHADGGVLTQELIESFCKELNIAPPRYLYGPNNTVFFNKPDFLAFVAAYDVLAMCIQNQDQLQRVIYDYLKRCYFEGAIYVEMICSPDHLRKERMSFDGIKEYRENGLTYKQFMDTVAHAIDQARAEFGIEARIRVALVRHTGFKACEEILNEAIKNPHPYVVGVDLVGDEAGFPGSDFTALYQRARKAGLKCSAHSGEHVSVDIMKQAIGDLNPDAIGHGLACVQDRDFLQTLADKKIGIQVCCGSNIALGLFNNRHEHPINQMLEAGIKVCIGSDDPPFFDTTIGTEYAKLKEELHLSDLQLLKICRDSIEVSFAQDKLKQKLFAHIDVYEACADLLSQVKATAALPKDYLDAFENYRHFSTFENCQKLFSQSSILDTCFEKIRDKTKQVFMRHQSYVERGK